MSAKVIDGGSLPIEEERKLALLKKHCLGKQFFRAVADLVARNSVCRDRFDDGEDPLERGQCAHEGGEGHHIATTHRGLEGRGNFAVVPMIHDFA